MTERWFGRAVLAATVGMGVAAGLARGQGPAMSPAQAAPTYALAAQAPSVQPAGYGSYQLDPVAESGGEEGCNCGNKLLVPRRSAALGTRSRKVRLLVAP